MRSLRSVAAAAERAALAVALLAASCSGSSPENRGGSPAEPSPLDGSSPRQVTGSPLPPRGTITLVGAGDIASCESPGDEQTAALVDATGGIVFTLGDNAYQDGTPEEYANCYAPSWGSFRGRTRPAAGNHDYDTEDAAGYFEYFGSAAGDPSTGYYSYDAGAWHIIVLNSNCEFVGGCGEGSPQDLWLQQDLTASSAECTLAYWHHPLFSSGTTHGSQPQVKRFWDLLYDAGAEVVVNGHEHNYERFGAQTPDGTADPERGIREFVVGTGGDALYPLGARLPNSENSDDQTWGVLELKLGPGAYSWEFLPVEGRAFGDVGEDVCH